MLQLLLPRAPIVVHLLRPQQSPTHTHTASDGVVNQIPHHTHPFFSSFYFPMTVCPLATIVQSQIHHINQPQIMGKGSNAQKNKRARENAMKRAASQGDGGGGAAGIAQRKGGGESARLEKEKLRDEVKAKKDAKKKLAEAKLAKEKRAREKALKKSAKK